MLCEWVTGCYLKEKARWDGLVVWLLMVIPINLANSFLAQIGRPQSTERCWLTFRVSNTFLFLTPNWNTLLFLQMFLIILLIYVIWQLVRSVIVKLDFLGQFQRDGNGFPEYQIHQYDTDSNLKRGFQHFMWPQFLFPTKMYKTNTLFFPTFLVLLIYQPWL